MLCEHPYEVLDGADALVVVTEWKAFRSPDFGRIRAALKTPVDLRWPQSLRSGRRSKRPDWPITASVAAAAWHGRLSMRGCNPASWSSASPSSRCRLTFIDDSVHALASADAEQSLRIAALERIVRDLRSELAGMRADGSHECAGRAAAAALLMYLHILISHGSTPWLTPCATSC